MHQCHKYPPTPLSGLKVRYSTHGPFFARLRYSLSTVKFEYIYIQKVLYIVARWNPMRTYLILPGLWQVIEWE